MYKNVFVRGSIAIVLAFLLCSFPVSMYAVNTASKAVIPAEEKISDTLYAEFARLEEESV